MKLLWQMSKNVEPTNRLLSIIAFDKFLTFALTDKPLIKRINKFPKFVKELTVKIPARDKVRGEGSVQSSEASLVEGGRTGEHSGDS